ncbi:MAG: tetratricopeptide repeat protein [Planctomycetales bacterium]|nr:tetratricopeptide repeat protein [Planctomycetales bacterium]
MIRFQLIVFLASVAILSCGCSKQLTDQRALALFQDGKFEDAIAEIDRVIDKSSDQDLVCDMQILKGRCLTSIAASERYADPDAATRNLEQAVIAFTRVVEFRPENPDPLYLRADAYEMLGDVDAAYKDSMAAKELDPEYKSAWTNKFEKTGISPETEQLWNKYKSGEGNPDYVPPDFLATNSEDSDEDAADPNQDPFAYSEDSETDPLNPGLDTKASDSVEPQTFANRGNRESSQNIDSEEGTESEPGSRLGVNDEEDETEQPVTPRRRRPRKDPLARNGSELEPLTPEMPEREETNIFSPQFPPTPTTPFRFRPTAPASTGLSGDYSPLQPSFNPDLPTTGYSGGPVSTLPPRGFAAAPSNQYQSYPNNYQMPSTGGYSGGGLNRGPVSPPVPPANTYGNGRYPSRNGQPIADHTNAFGNAPIVAPAPFLPQTQNPLSHVPRVPTMRDFYVPETFTPNRVPTTSAYSGQR